MKDPVLPKQSSEKRTELKMSLFDFRVYCKATVIKQHSIDTHTHTHTLRSVKQSREPRNTHTHTHIHTHTHTHLDQ